MADLSALAALKAQLEADQDVDTEAATTQQAVADTDACPTPSSAEPKNEEQQQKRTEIAVAAILRHTERNPESITADLSLKDIELGPLARWSIASTIETELHCEISDSEVNNWSTVADVLTSAQAQ